MFQIVDHWTNCKVLFCINKTWSEEILIIKYLKFKCMAWNTALIYQQCLNTLNLLSSPLTQISQLSLPNVHSGKSIENSKYITDSICLHYTRVIILEAPKLGKFQKSQKSHQLKNWETGKLRETWFCIIYLCDFV